jgi:hypothetical protein
LELAWRPSFLFSEFLCLMRVHLSLSFRELYSFCMSSMEKRSSST